MLLLSFVNMGYTNIIWLKEFISVHSAQLWEKPRIPSVSALILDFNHYGLKGVKVLNLLELAGTL